jgi:hypothetical protein
MSEAAAQYFRQAYAQKPHPETAIFLAQEELRLDNRERARDLLAAANLRRNELGAALAAELEALERQFRTDAPLSPRHQVEPGAV